MSSPLKSMLTWSQLNFNSPQSPIQMEMITLHDHILSILGLILVVVLGLMMSLINNKTNFIRSHSNANLLEFIWTILPGVLLLFLAFPSLRLLYLLDEVDSVDGTLLKVVGHQWYWTYSMSDSEVKEAYIMKDYPNFYMLDTDQRAMVFQNMNTNINLTSGDVLHSWTIPSLGVKMDAVPGRLNMSNFTSLMSGVYYGQCSEICGANHSFMPIVLESIFLTSLL